MITDIVIILLSFYLLTIGSARGFIDSLAVPISVIVAVMISLFFYQATKNVAISLAIVLLGPIFLHIGFKSLFKKWTTAMNRDIRPSPLSRLGGALVTFAWGWVFIIFTLTMLAVLPPWGKTLTAVHHDVTNSTSYSFVTPWRKILFVSPATSGTDNDEGSLAEDPLFQKVLQDPDIQKDIDDHDIAKLIQNPEMIDLVQGIISDPATMKKVLAVYSSPSEQTAKNP